MPRGSIILLLIDVVVVVCVGVGVGVGESFGTASMTQHPWHACRPTVHQGHLPMILIAYPCPLTPLNLGVTLR